MNREILPSVAAVQQEQLHTYTFYKKDAHWFIDLADHKDAGWQGGDVEMVEGADKLLNLASRGKNKVRLYLCTQPFHGARVLRLKAHCPAPKGGAMYSLESHQGTIIHPSIWVCDIALLIFGDLPDEIYLKKAPASTAV